jgi:hypothetical protein
MKISKKAYLVLFSLILVLFLSCGSIVDAVLPPVQQLHWKLGEFVNEWQEPLGKYFIRYEGTVHAQFFTQSNRRNDQDIRDITFSEAEGFTFLIPSTTGSGPIGSMEVDVVIRSSVENEILFNGFYNSSKNKVQVAYSTELCDILLMENVIIRLSMSNAFYRYQFSLPEKYPQGYEILKNKEKR